MQASLKTLGLITARGGSKGLPGKNTRPVNGGKPLIDWTIRAGLNARCIDRLVLSSEDPDICRIAAELGCEVPFVRPAALATDTADTMSVIRHALAELPGYDRIVLLQPTCPARTAEDIDSAIYQMDALSAPACVSVTAVKKSPYWMFWQDDHHRLRPLIPNTGEASRRQDLPQFYSLNGAVYCADTDWLLRQKSFVGTETVAYVMPETRSLDIDTLADFEAFERSLTEQE